MIFKSKYKIYQKSKKIIDAFPKRILRFKRTKWKFLKKSYRYASKRKRFCNFNCKTVLRGRKFIRMKYKYKDSLLTKIHLMQMFGNGYNIKQAKKDLSKSTDFSKTYNILLVKQLFRLDILLWKLHVFGTLSESITSINKHLILVNDMSVAPTYFLKTGDVIKLNYDLDFPKIKVILGKRRASKYRFFPKVYPFVEFDFYLGYIIILKDFKDVSLDESSFFVSKPIRYNKFYDYISK
jgi:ribosomal 50S subunit-recycling heat shock protein